MNFIGWRIYLILLAVGPRIYLSDQAGLQSTRVTGTLIR